MSGAADLVELYGTAVPPVAGRTLAAGPLTAGSRRATCGT